MDDIDLNLSEEEKPEAEPEGDGPVVKPVRSVISLLSWHLIHVLCG